MWIKVFVKAEGKHMKYISVVFPHYANRKCNCGGFIKLLYFYQNIFAVANYSGKKTNKRTQGCLKQADMQHS